MTNPTLRAIDDFVLEIQMNPLFNGRGHPDSLGRMYQEMRRARRALASAKRTLPLAGADLPSLCEAIATDTLPCNPRFRAMARSVHALLLSGADAPKEKPAPKTPRKKPAKKK